MLADGQRSEGAQCGGAGACPQGARRFRRKGGWAEFIVDMWITNLHGVKCGLYKPSCNRAKSRQFTSDMDIFAEVIEHGERTRLLGYREDLWRKHAGMDRRLVLKLFNETLNWRASMDLMIGRSLHLRLGARGLPVTAFSINVNEHDDVVYLERSANKWPFAPEHFSFFLLDDGQPQFYRLKRDVIDLAASTRCSATATRWWAGSIARCSRSAASGAEACIGTTPTRALLSLADAIPRIRC